MKKITVLLILSIVICAGLLSGCTSQQQLTVNKGNQTAPPQSPTQNSTTPPSSPASSSVNVGDTINGKYLQVTVLSAQFVNSFNETSGGYKFTVNADEGKTFLIIKVLLHQIGDDSQLVSPTDFWVIDNKNTKYDYDYRTYSLNDSLSTTTLYKNLNTEGRILYQVPKIATGLKVQYNFATFWDSPVIAEWSITTPQ